MSNDVATAAPDIIVRDFAFSPAVPNSTSQPVPGQLSVPNIAGPAATPEIPSKDTAISGKLPYAKYYDPNWTISEGWDSSDPDLPTPVSARPSTHTPPPPQLQKHASSTSQPSTRNQSQNSAYSTYSTTPVRTHQPSFSRPTLPTVVSGDWAEATKSHRQTSNTSNFSAYSTLEEEWGSS